MIRVGIFMGGSSREREVSFAGGRTIYDSLDRALFEPIPIFVDDFGALTVLDWQFLYKGTIRDFFPPAHLLPDNAFPYLLSHFAALYDETHQAARKAVGHPIAFEELTNWVDIVFLTLHGLNGEDGTIQGLLQWLGIPYTGSGVFTSATGFDKIRQRPYMWPDDSSERPKDMIIAVADIEQSPDGLMQSIADTVGFPCVIKHPTQGSSIGIAIVQDRESLLAGLQQAAFQYAISPVDFKALSDAEQVMLVRQMMDIRYHIGWLDMPSYFTRDGIGWIDYLKSADRPAILRAPDSPTHLLIEAFVSGQEFSIIVLETPEGEPVPLPITEIIKSSTLYDYRSKYLAGVSSKKTPPETISESYQAIIQQAAAHIKQTIDFEVYARIDGILTPVESNSSDKTSSVASWKPFFNDANTTSGMLPSSFFFHQAATVGISPKQLLTYIIVQSLIRRSTLGGLIGDNARQLNDQLHNLRAAVLQSTSPALRVGVILGGYSSERHISVESGRNIYQKLSASTAYRPTAYFLLNNDYLTEEQRAQLNLSENDTFSLWRLPIDLLLKDNADDIAQAIVHATAKLTGSWNAEKTMYIFSHDSSNQSIGHQQTDATDIANLQNNLRVHFAEQKDDHLAYLPINACAKTMDFAFIALHGRPGEDGTLQGILEDLGVPYNGSRPASAQLTIDKFETNERLKQASLLVTSHLLIHQKYWQANRDTCIVAAINALGLPLVAKPNDDGCSSAVKVIKSTKELELYCAMLFRESKLLEESFCEAFHLKPSEEIPNKAVVLLESLIGPNGATHFLEVTVGFMTEYDSKGELIYTVFEPSEVVSSGSILSLEEKFLAGEGQNITPARFDSDAAEQTRISQAVQAAIERGVRALGCVGYGRVDAFVRIFDTGTVETIFIEINSLPGMTPATCIFHQAALAGLQPIDFIDRIIQHGIQCQEQRLSESYAT
jgi:UDP-N-acetylmuramate--alanine ligase